MTVLRTWNMSVLPYAQTFNLTRTENGIFLLERFFNAQREVFFKLLIIRT